MWGGDSDWSWLGSLFYPLAEAWPGGVFKRGGRDSLAIFSEAKKREWSLSLLTVSLLYFPFLWSPPPSLFCLPLSSISLYPFEGIEKEKVMRL